MNRFAAAFFGLAVASSAVSAADLPSRKGAIAPPPAPTSCKETESTALSSDIFGFSSGSDVADVGSLSIAGTYTGAFKGAGFKPGSFNGHSGQLQATTSFFPCWEFGPYLTGTTSQGSFRGVPGNVRFNSFGGGVENKWKVLGRATHGIGLTLDWDINYQGYSQKDSTFIPTLSTSGGAVTSSYRIFIDKELIPGKLFGALNVAWDQIWFQRPALVAPFGGDYLRQSNITFSGALSYQVVDGFYLGGEARYVRTHLGNYFNRTTGDGVYVGPTFLWQVNKSLAISGAYGIQVAGSQKAISPAVLAPQFASSDLNLSTLSQHIAKVKVSYAF